jgi:hypothetical protein
MILTIDETFNPSEDIIDVASTSMKSPDFILAEMQNSLAHHGESSV